MITSFFKKATRETKELENLQAVQLSRNRAEEKAKREAEITNISLQLRRQEVIEIDDDESADHDAGEVVLNCVQNMLTSSVSVTTSTCETVKRKKRSYNPRPANWTDITLDFMTYKNQERTMKKFELNLESDAGAEGKMKNFQHWNTKLNRWAKQIHTRGDDDFKKIGKLPPYGKAIDDELAEIVRNYNKNGVPITDYILRCCLIELISKRRPKFFKRIVEVHATVPKTKPKMYKFAQSWATRFWKRHQLSSRVSTTKMRDDLPADYEKKVEVFENLLSLAIHKHNVPDELIVGLDETNTQFVPSVKRTRVPTGTKRVRVIGVGHEKPQITTTIAVSATGNIIEPTQLIFGGKTNTSLPNKGKTAPPVGQYFDKTATHWQTPESFITYISKTLIPYRKKVIEEKGLSDDQKMILILDLHYSHKDSAVLALLKVNNIIPIFIPAGCTDAHQVLDVVVNKPYKNGVVNGFIDYASRLFEEWNRTKTDEDECFRMNLALSVMKPEIPGFVGRGINALKNNLMKAAIIGCFNDAGRVGFAKLNETYERALRVVPEQTEAGDVDAVIPEGLEEEEDIGPVNEETELNQQIQEADVDSDDFLVEVGHEDGQNCHTLLSDISDSDDSDDDSSSSDDCPVVETGRRVRKPNTMMGSVKKSKYSK